MATVFKQWAYWTQCALSPLNSYCCAEVCAAHFQRTWEHKLFSKNPLLQKASLKLLYFVLAVEGCWWGCVYLLHILFGAGPLSLSQVIWELCYLVTGSCFPWPCLPPHEIHDVEGRTAQEDAPCTYTWCESCWLGAEGGICFSVHSSRAEPFLCPEDHLYPCSVVWGGTLESGWIHRKLQSWAPRQGVASDFSVYFVFTALSFK